LTKNKVPKAPLAVPWGFFAFWGLLAAVLVCGNGVCRIEYKKEKTGESRFF